MFELYLYNIREQTQFEHVFHNQRSEGLVLGVNETPFSPFPLKKHQTINRHGPVGLHFIGAGVSGGEDGARYGPSIMPGGAPEAWPHVKDIFQTIAAKVDGAPCCDWVGQGGAGHFVKMVHNGIEYGDMQLIAEVYHLMKVMKTTYVRFYFDRK